LRQNRFNDGAYGPQTSSTAKGEAAEMTEQRKERLCDKATDPQRRFLRYLVDAGGKITWNEYHDLKVHKNTTAACQDRKWIDLWGPRAGADRKPGWAERCGIGITPDGESAILE